MQKIWVCLLAIGFVFVFSAPAPAADGSLEDRVKALEDTIGSWSIYGSARFQTFYKDNNINDDTDNQDLVWDSAANARLGGKMVKDKISGVYELGVDDDNGVSTRLIYASYDFGAGKLVIGQDYTPLGSMFYSNQVVANDNDLLGWGAIYAGRVPQIKLQLKNGLEFALVENKSSSKLNAFSGDVDALMPKLEVRYNLKSGMFFADIFGGYSTFKVEDVVMVQGGANFGDETLNAWAVGVGGGLNLDPAFIRAQVYMAQNAKNFGLSHTDANGAMFDDQGSIVDEDNFGAHIVVGTKISNKYVVEAGYGYVSSELDVSGSDKNTAMSYYLNATIPVYGSFFVVPEVGVFDYADGADGEDEHKDTTYFGAKWQINF